MQSIFDKNMDVMSKSMDMLLLRQTVTADNIANAETPMFKARRVEFESQLQQAVDAESMGLSRNIASITPTIFEDAESETGQDLNTVDMDREMSEMTKNDLKYSAVSQAISKKFALLQYAISEGGSK